MKKLVLLLFVSMAFGQSTTPNLGLTILPHAAPNWDTATNANWNLVDAGTILKTPITDQAITGGHTFTINGNFVVDATGNLQLNPFAGFISMDGVSGNASFGNIFIDKNAALTNCGTSSSMCWTSGSGSPEGVVTARVGSIYSNFTAVGSLYYKSNGVSNTGWLALSTMTPSGNKILNGVSYSASYSGATLDVRANACLADAEALANGNTTGICDATGETGNQTIAAQINVGDASEDEVAFRVPVSAVWTATMADGTSCAIKQYGNASIIGSPASGLNKTFKIQPGNSSNLGYIYCTDTASNSNYMYASGFTIYNQAVATANNIGMYVAGFIFDSSHWENIYVLDAKDNYAMKVYGACCSATFSNMQIDSEFVAGGTPLWVAQDGSTSVKTQGLNFVDMTIVKPGATKPLIKITDTTHTMALNFTNVYSETSNSDTTTALYQISGARSVNFNGVNFHANVASSTATGITVDNSYNTMLTVQGLTMGPGAGTFTYPATAVADSNLGYTFPTSIVGNLPQYPLPVSGGYATTAESYGAATSATAAVNTTAIQTALNKTGMVTLLTPGTFQVSSALVINSNTYFKLGNATRLQIVANPSTQILINNGYNTFASTTSTTITWTSGTSISVAWTAHGLSVGQWVYLSGANQSVFNGVFQVTAVADANDFTVVLYRQPTTGATGTTVGQVADTNIIVDGGIWDQNYPTTPISTGDKNGDSILLSSVSGGEIKNITCINSTLHCISVAAIANYTISNIAYSQATTQPVNYPGDLVKAYGPEYNVKITNIYGTGIDDGSSFQTKEAVAFPNASWTFGDIINCGFDHVNLVQPANANDTGLLVFYASVNEYMGGVYARNISGSAKANGISVAAAFDNAVVDNVEIDNVSMPANQPIKIVQSVGSTAFTVNSVTVKNLTFVPIQSSSQILGIGSTIVVQKLRFENLDVTNNSTLVGGSFLLDIAGTVNNLSINGGTIQGSNPRFIKEESTATIKVISIDGITTSSADQVVNIVASVATAPQINITNSDISTSTTILNLAASSNVYLAGNRLTLSSGANGVIQTTGAITINYAAFGNNLTQGVYQKTSSGTPVLASVVCDLAGNCTNSNTQVIGATATTFGAGLTFQSAPCETTYGITTLATGATTTDTGLNCLPANSIIDAVVGRVTTTITAACTGWELGDATTAARFSSNNTTLTATTTTDAAHIGTFNNSGIASATTGVWQAAAAKVRITCAGGNPGAGAVRVIVFYHTWAAPTS